MSTSAGLFGAFPAQVLHVRLRGRQQMKLVKPTRTQPNTTAAAKFRNETIKQSGPPRRQTKQGFPALIGG